ncbi:hypothetical protein Hypma_003681 [Hypsizygus marmoreus]|uniref:Uncharacterized protein n=1 Tax=Hypsizygus marmoreus TaxID=39966 RepID=A0A369J1F1_HYPMA|nr:hypothetical protein Hypma_003681 [Hypsizygus marmoreus]
MGRPKLHHTPEQRKAADREKSKRHYEKNKTTIQAKRSLRYREQSKTSVTPFPPPAETRAVEHMSKTDHTDHQVQFWAKRVKRLSVKLNNIVGNTPFAFIDNVCMAYINSHNVESIRDAVSVIMPLQTLVQQYQDKLLQLTGPVGKEWKDAEGVAKSVRGIVHQLEDLECTAMDDYNELVLLHRDNKLMYQSL